MSAENVRQIIGRALIDKAYRELLFADPPHAVEGYDLSGEELAGLKGLSKDQFDAEAGELEQRTSRAGINLTLDHELVQRSASRFDPYKNFKF